jgi:hypothetical protein
MVRPLKIHLVSDFVECKVLSKELAWEQYGSALGAPTKNAWDSQTSQNKSISDSNRVACHVLAPVRFLSDPLLLSDTEVELSLNAAQMGRYLNEEEVSRILSMCEAGQSVGESKLASAQEDHFPAPEATEIERVLELVRVAKGLVFAAGSKDKAKQLIDAI